MPYASEEVVVNTWPTRNIPWTVRVTDGDIRDEDFDEGFLRSLVEAVKNLPARVKIPKHGLLGLPRYYLVVVGVDGMKVTRVVDIVGVKYNLAPTRWSYTTGYWHPACQLAIADAILELLQKKDPELGNRGG